MLTSTKEEGGTLTATLLERHGQLAKKPIKRGKTDSKEVDEDEDEKKVL